MVKKLIASCFLLGVLGGCIPISELSAQDTIIVGGVWPTKNFTADLTIPAPAPSSSLLTEADRAKAGWVYFWMYDDGVFTRLETPTRTFPNNQDYNTALKVRGRYSDDPEPPRMPARVNAGGSTTPSTPADSLPANSETAIFSNWGASRIGDTIYLALVVKNRNDKFQTRSGWLSMLCPKSAFRYVREVFPSLTDRFGNVDSSAVTSTDMLYKWRLTNVPIVQTQTLFIEMAVNSTARDSTTYLLQTKLEWDDELSSTVKTSLPTILGISTNNSDSDSEPPNSFYFEAEAKTDMKVNRSRDPNALEVIPAEVPPGINAPIHKLQYTVFVENIGTATTPNLNVEVTFDNHINTGSYSFVSQDFKMPVTFPASPCCVGNKAVFALNGINLPPSLGGANPAGKGSFTFTMDTKPGQNLLDGDQIRANAVIRMVNNTFLEEDVEPTGPAIVDVRKPARLCYGWLLGVKLHSHLPNPDSLRNLGLNLTFQIPLCRSKSTIQSKHLKPPSWYWQFELGLGKSTFNLDSDHSRYSANYLNLTPVQLRYTNIPVGPLHFGVSAGYSLDIVYSATKDDVKTALKPGFGNRLEHELAASLDVFNLTSVPGIAIGAGYKYRFNQLFADNAQYGFPFAYLQVNFAHFQRRQIQLWNKIYRS